MGEDGSAQGQDVVQAEEEGTGGGEGRGGGGEGAGERTEGIRLLLLCRQVLPALQEIRPVLPKVLPGAGVPQISTNLCIFQHSPLLSLSLLLPYP